MILVEEKKYNMIQSFCHITCKILEKKKILTLVLSGETILNERKKP